MHFLESKDGFNLGSNGRFSGGKYVCEDSISGTMLSSLLGIKLTAINRDSSPFPVFDETKDWNGKSILILRSGALGDMVLLTPCINEIHRRWPTVKIGISCMNQFAELVSMMHQVHFVTFPADVKIVENYDAVIMMENSVENNPAAEKMHMTDAFAERIGLTHIHDKKPLLWVSKEMRDNMLVRFPRRPGVPRIAVQTRASGNLRTYPDPYMSLIMREIHLVRGWDVYLLGVPGQEKAQSIERMTNCMSLGLSIRESLALLATCDLALAPDSFIVHAAAALNIPVLGLYGAFDGELRAKYSPSVTVMQAEGHCAPCFYHDRPDNPVNPAGPCSLTGRCEVLVSLTPARIVKKLDAMAEKLPKLKIT
jgi:ADP-heptose:LPS heptosyltransferase